jgi:3-oxoacyl-[acyl-carrier protein] reductase
MNELQGRIALVTGGSRGIGRATALALAQAGCDVAVGYQRAAEEAAEVVAEIRVLKCRAISVQANVAEPREAARTVREVEEGLGPIGVLVNNAGISAKKPLAEITPEDWTHTISINLSSAFYVTQAVLPSMRARQWGRIIMLASIAAQTGGVIGPHYAASKAGLIGLMHSYASLLAKEGITANAIAPALIETDMIKGNEAIKPTLIPLGRFGKAGEVASVVTLLAMNGYVTGQTISVNGGWHMS